MNTNHFHYEQPLGNQNGILYYETKKAARASSPLLRAVLAWFVTVTVTAFTHRRRYCLDYSQ